MSNGHRSDCDGCVPCEEPGCPEIAYCVNEWPVLRPCPHNEPYCPDHNIENCLDCRLEAEREMARSGEYDPRADPLYDHTVTEQAKHWWEHRRDGSDFDPTTNSYKPRKRRGA